jgi:hypothetical protein
MAGQSAGHAMTAASSDGNRAPALQTHMELRTPERDRNREFLCTYGYAVSSYFNSFSSEVFEGWQHYAVPIRGEGASVSEIVVTDSQPSGSISSDFTVGIYKNTNGRPGKLIAGGTGQAQGSCLPTKVVIPKTFLAAGKKYWIEENARACFSPPSYCENAVSWGYKPNVRHNAYYQYYKYSPQSSYLSDWLPVSGPAPFVKVK